jgi:Peptidase family M28
MKTASMRIAPVIVLLLLLSAPSAAREGRFSGQRAMEWLQYQCDLGPRTPESPGHAALRSTIKSLADSLGFTAHEICFTRDDPYAEQDLTLCNIVVSTGPRESLHLWLGAHFDSRPFCDKDPDPEKAKLPLVGANDAASGTAVLLHLMEIFAEHPPSRAVDLIFFDGEDYGHAGDIEGFCLGSKRLARTWRNFGSPLQHEKIEGLIVLDMVAEKNARIPMEAHSLRYAENLTMRVFERAADLGLETFEMVPGPPVYDDHVPFLEMGIPAVDLIDFDYPQWHTADDTPEYCSAASLEDVGTLILDIAYKPLN